MPSSFRKENKCSINIAMTPRGMTTKSCLFIAFLLLLFTVYCLDISVHLDCFKLLEFYNNKKFIHSFMNSTSIQISTKINSKTTTKNTLHCCCHLMHVVRTAVDINFDGGQSS